MYLDDKLYIDIYIYISANTGNDRQGWDADRLANYDNDERVKPKNKRIEKTCKVFNSLTKNQILIIRSCFSVKLQIFVEVGFEIHQTQTL